MSMVRIEREGLTVNVILFTDVPVDDEPGLFWTIPCKHACPDELHANLLCRHLRQQLAEAVQQTRRESYNQGYRDGRAKRRKQVFFSSCLGGC